MRTEMLAPVRILVTPALVAALLASGCGKPERPNPAGPGVTPDKSSAKVEDVPKVNESARASSLSLEQRKIVVAKIGDKTITLGDLEARLDQETPPVKSQFASVQKRKDYLGKMVQFEVLVAEAQRQGLDKDPEVLEAMRQMMVRKYLQEAAKDEVDPKALPEADLKAYYDANRGVFHKPEMVEISHMLLADKAKAEQVRAELQRGSDGNTSKLVALWNDYVGRYSEDKATVQYLGALGAVPKEPPPATAMDELEHYNAIPKALIEAAFAAETYSVGPVVQSDKGYHVFMVTSRTPAVDKSFDEAKESIRSRIAKRERDLRRERLLAELRKKTPVEINDDAVRLLPAPKSDNPTPAKGKGDGAAVPAAATETGAK